MIMNEKTRIFNDDAEGFSEDDSLGFNEFEQNEPEEDVVDGKSPMPGYISLGIGVAVGLGAGIIGSHIAYAGRTEDLPEEPSPIPETSFLAEILVKAKTPIAKGITEDMSLEEAYAFAREQVGPGGVFVWNGAVYGTYTEEEWSALSTEQQNDYYSSFNLLPEETEQPNLFDNVQLSTSVNDEMTFGEAFANARNEMGSGGVFIWRENAYNTFYKEEWAQMAPEERESFLAAYLDIPDSEFLPTAESLSENAVDQTDEEQHPSENEYAQAEYVEDYPIAEAVHPEGVHDDIPGFIDDPIYVASPVVDTSSSFDDPAAELGLEYMPDPEIPGASQNVDDMSLIDSNVSENDFIHELLYGSKNADQEYTENPDDVFPDDLVTGIDAPDDINI